MAKNNEILKFLKFLFEGKSEDEYIDVRVLKNGKMIQQFFTDIAKAAIFLEENKEYDCYVGVCPRTKASGSKDAVNRGHALWFDIDFHDDNLSKDEIVERTQDMISKFAIEHGLPPPTCVVFTGRGVHIYYKLNNWIEANKLEAVLKDYVKKLHSMFPNNVDEKVAEIARIMRVPGTKNTKVGVFAEIVYMDPTTVLNIDEHLRGENRLQTTIKQGVDASEFMYVLTPNQRRFLAEFFKFFWLPGHRQNLTMYLCGFLIKHNVNPYETVNIVGQVVSENDEEAKQRLYNVVYHYEKVLSKKPIEELKGISGIAEEIFKIVEELKKLPEEELEDILAKRGIDPRKLKFFAKKKMREGKEIYTVYDPLRRLLKDSEFILTPDDVLKYVKAWFFGKRFNRILSNLKEYDEQTFQLIKPSDLFSIETDIDFYIKPFLPKSALIIFAGMPESFKSFFSLFLGVLMATGRKYGPLEPHNPHPRVLILDAENSRIGLSRRLKTLIKLLKLSDEEVKMLDENLGISLGLTPINLRMFKDYDVIIFDSFRRFLKGEESSSEVINEFYKAIEPLKRMGKTIILIHHKRKRPPGREPGYIDPLEEVRGSTDITAMVDYVYIFEKNDGMSGATITLKKDRDGLKVLFEEMNNAWFFGVTAEEIRLETTAVISAEMELKEAITKYLISKPTRTADSIKEIVDALYTQFNEKYDWDYRTLQNRVSTILDVMSIHGEVRIQKKGNRKIVMYFGIPSNQRSMVDYDGETD
ncbi:MAG: AAA family ATPase [Candidatus Hodarchaeales archaeon]